MKAAWRSFFFAEETGGAVLRSVCLDIYNKKNRSGGARGASSEETSDFDRFL